MSGLRAPWPWLVLAGVLALAGGLLLWETRGLIFFYDEWTFLLVRQDHDASAFLAPHNEHPVLVPVLIWKALWTIFGTSHYLPYRLLIIAVHLLTCVLLFLVARRRLGAPLALVATALVAFLGPAYEDLLWPFQVSFIGPVTCWLAIVLALDHGRDRLAAMLLTIALFCSGSGAPVAAGTAVAVLLGPGPRRRALRVLALPLILYGAWLVTYGVRGSFTPSNVKTTPELVLNSAAACLAALTALPWQWGRPLAVALAVALVWRLARRARPDAALLAALTTALALWGAQGLFRGGAGAPPPSHYLYPGAVFLVVVLIELAPRPLPRLPPLALAAVGAATAVIVVFNADTLRRGAVAFRISSELLAPELGALEHARGAAAPGFAPDPAVAPQITAGPYFAAIDRTGSIADAPSAIAARPELARQAADVTLLRALRVGLRPAPEGCSTRRPGGAELALPRGGLVLRASGGPVTLALRRFAAGYASPGRPPGQKALGEHAETLPVAFAAPPAFRLLPGRAARLAPPGDGWHARVQGPGQVSVCTS